MWEDLEVDGRISFKTSEHQNRLAAPILELEEEHHTRMRFVASVAGSLLGKEFLIFQ